MAGEDDEDFVPVGKETGGSKAATKVENFDDQDDDVEDDTEVVIEGDEGSNDGEDDSLKKTSKEDRFKTESGERRLKKRNRNRHYRRDPHAERRLLQENNELKRRLENVENQVKDGFTNIQSGTIDQQIAEANTIYNRAKQVHAQAVKDGDGEKAAEAMEAMIEAKDAIKDFQAYKKQGGRDRDDNRGQDNTRRAAPKMDPDVESHFERWHRQNPWYDRRIGDKESRIAYSIDNMLVAEGYDPRSEEYWEELDERCRANPKLAHLYEEDDDNENEDDMEDEEERRPARRKEASTAPRKKPSPPTGRTPQTNGIKRKIVVSRERAEAMREMGLEPGTKEWNKMAKKYADYDKTANR